MGAPRFEALVHHGRAAELPALRLRHAARPVDRAGGVRTGDVGGDRAAVLRPDGAAARRRGAAGAAGGADAAGELRARARRQPQSALRTVADMSLVNFTAREITCKIVYYGPGRSGKTTNLQYVYGRVPESRRGRMVSLATQTDRTLFFDFLPLELGTISGFTTKFQLYTVPGQSYYNATRKLVLQGADGVVFVADSQARRFDDNLESLQNLQDNLLAQGVDIRQLPGGLPVQQAGPAARPDPHPRGDGRRAQLPRGAELRRPTRCTAPACSRRCGASRSWCSSGSPRERSPDDASRSTRCTASTPSWSARRIAWPSRRRKAVAESPGTVYNPLFIYARPGPGEDAPADGRGPRGPRDRPRPRRSSISPSTSSSRRFTPRSPPGTARRTGSASSTWICCWWTTSSS